MHLLRPLIPQEVTPIRIRLHLLEHEQLLQAQLNNAGRDLSTQCHRSVPVLTSFCRELYEAKVSHLIFLLPSQPTNALLTQTNAIYSLHDQHRISASLPNPRYLYQTSSDHVESRKIMSRDERLRLRTLNLGSFPNRPGEPNERRKEASRA